MQTEISQRGPITCVSVVLERRSDACIETGSGSICERVRERARVFGKHEVETTVWRC